MKYIILLLMSFAASGCIISGQKLAPEIIDFKNMPHKAELTSSPVMIAADLQIHYVLNSNSARKNIKDTISEAIRPVEADIFASLNFKREVEEFKTKYPAGKMIFLGDMLDVACRSELDYFLSLMASSANWVMAPGNHDAAFMGVFEKPSVTKAWQDACDTKNGRDNKVNKIQLIFAYLNALAMQSYIANADYSYTRFRLAFEDAMRDRHKVSNLMQNMSMQTSNEDDSDVQCPSVSINGSFLNCDISKFVDEKYKNIPNQGWWRNNSDQKDKEFLQDVFWHINPNYPINSFIVQKVRLPDGTFAILLDSINPAKNRDLHTYPIKYNASTSANLLDVQTNVVALLMNASQPYSPDPDNEDEVSRSSDNHVLMAHHPVKDFAFRARRSLCNLIHRGNVKTVFTAHTHKSFKQTHEFYFPSKKVSCGEITENNIGSLIDADLELSVLFNPKSGLSNNFYKVDLSEHYSDNVCHEKSDSDIKDWKKDHKYYFSYTKEGLFASTYKVQKHLMLRLLNIYKDMMQTKYGFTTESAHWPDSFATDNEILQEIVKLRGELLEEDEWYKEQFLPRFLVLQSFFQSRTVVNQNKMDIFVTCHLLWASQAKKELSFWDRQWF